ncbi:MAG: hypothetical protein J6Z36_05280 [Clostridia bacterium]|nr:hypothetical protein [Clostridia bacterium]
MQHVIIKAEDAREQMKNTDTRFMRLWDLYRGLLTPTQREIADLYFDCDLSLWEIAEQKGVSRQSVSDCLQKCRKKLEQAEEKLHFSELLTEGDRQFSQYMTAVNRWISEQRQKHPEWSSELDDLKARAEKDLNIIEIE